MKKQMSFLLSVLLVLSTVLFTACGSSGDVKDSRYPGTWTAAGVAIGDTMEPFEEEWVLELKEDGTGTLSSGAEDREPDEFTWKLVDGGFKCSGDLKTTFKDDGEYIKTKIIGVNLIFEKKS